MLIRFLNSKSAPDRPDLENDILFGKHFIQFFKSKPNIMKYKDFWKGLLIRFAKSKSGVRSPGAGNGILSGVVRSGVGSSGDPNLFSEIPFQFLWDFLMCPTRTRFNVIARHFWHSPPQVVHTVMSARQG